MSGKRTESEGWVQPSEKVLKLYHAVRFLLEEGRNPALLTVSEITEKAGIGKGTAYEYFKSKDEMIARALIYEIAMEFQDLKERTERLPTFREKYMEILRWMERIFYGEGSAAVFRQIAQESLQFSGALKAEVEKYGCNPELVFEQIKEFLRNWNQTESWKAACSDEIQTCMIISSFASFWIYLNRNPQSGTQEREQLKDYLFRCLIHNLSCDYEEPESL